VPCSGICQYGRQFVGGQGPVPADYLVVGEAPGAVELDTGLPFQGPAGRLLNRLLGLAGIDRENCRVVNAVCCVDLKREIRKPLPDEIEACWPRLQLEVTNCDPKVIILLGNVALTKFFPGMTITQARGKFRSYNGTPVIATYHPAYCLRNPIGTPLVVADLELAHDYTR
jgi:uracil-DNA glycosylase